MAELHDTPKSGDLVFDIGMHKGEDTEFYLKKGFRVVSFEADPDLVAGCSARFREFIDSKQLTIVAGAIVDSDAGGTDPGKVLFYRNNEVSVWGTVSANWAQRNVRLGSSSTPIEVDVVDLAAVIRQHGVPHYMKIDIEGADLVCVKALRRFRNRPDYVSIESDKTSFANIRREIGVLTDLGYTAFQAIEQSSIPRTQVPPDPAREGAFISHRFPDGSSGVFGMELGENWRSRGMILLQYRFIRFGYYLVGDDGVLSRMRFAGAGRLRLAISRFLSLFTNAPVPGWYDTHARHRSAATQHS